MRFLHPPWGVPASLGADGTCSSKFFSHSVLHPSGAYRHCYRLMLLPVHGSLLAVSSLVAPTRLAAPQASGASSVLPEAWFVKTETFVAGKPFPEIRPHLEAHKAWVANLRQQGATITSGYRVDADGRPGGGGLMLFRAASHAAAEQLCLQDPLVSSGCVEWVVNGWVAEVGNLELVDGGAWCEKQAALPDSPSQRNDPPTAGGGRQLEVAVVTVAFGRVGARTALPCLAAPRCSVPRSRTPLLQTASRRPCAVRSRSGARSCGGA